MTIHIISVGLSLRDSLSDPRNPRGKLSASSAKDAVLREKPQDLLGDVLSRDGDRDPRDVAAEWLLGALTPLGEPGHLPGNADRVASLARAVQPALWPADLSAELDTFDRVGAGRPLRPSDVAVLICSDTPPGLVAGLWNAAALTTGDLSRVRFLPAPDTPLPRRQEGGAILARVCGMDAGDERGFAEAMRGLGALGRNLLGTSGDGEPFLREGEPFHFYLSGGFKAAIPYLIGLAEGMRSVDPAHEVQAFVLHETASRDAPAIPLPLRWLVPSQVKEELAGFDSNGKRPGIPRPSLLRGYAYQALGSTCVLTPFGEGLRALFGLTPERVGG